MKFLRTRMHEIETTSELQKYIDENSKVMVCCGRMGPMCIPVYEAMEELMDDEEYQEVRFAVMGFDNPEASVIRNAPETKGFMGLPFTMYYKNGKTVHATTSIQSKEMVSAILDQKVLG